MNPNKKIVVVILAAWSWANQSSAQALPAFLEHEALPSPSPLVCSQQDDSWIAKSGPDLIAPPPPKIESQTLFLQANNLNGQYNSLHLAQGNVIGYKANQTLFSDWLIYDQANDRVTAGDNLVLTRQYDAIQGKWADYYLDLNKGTFTQARAYYNKENLSATGSKIDVLDSNHLNISNGYVTSCNPNDPAWYIKSQQMTFDYQNSEGTARNARMYFESIPIFSAPYMTFPLGQRKSGWLIPNVGGTATSGFMYSQGYYWNMAPNYDMTITPEFWANRGFMLTDQFRYLTENNSGSIYTEQMPYSYAAEQNGSSHYRWYWSLTDTYTPLKNVTLGYNYNQVSDNNYFNDFGNFYSVTDNVNLNQSAFINYTPTWGLANIKLQNYQTLYPYGYTQTVPIYASYPAINLNVNQQPIVAGFNAGLTSQYTYFYSPSMQSGQRTVLYPSITYPLRNSWGFVTPKVGYSYTDYNLGSAPGYPNSGGQIQRTIPISSIDSGLYFDRQLGLGSKSITQTFEPRLYYLYIPGVNQANIPLFDTATATYNFNQLFNENRFSGFDRINQANDVTVGATTRLINDYNGSELMNLSAGYRYYITPENNFLYGNQSQYAQLFLPNPNLISELNNNWSKSLTTRASVQYDTVNNNLDAYTIGLKYNPDDGKVINIGYSYQYQLPLLFYSFTPGQQFTPAGFENQYALNIAGQWPIYQNKVYAVGRANYDFTRELFLNFIGGAEYNGGCYTISAVYEQFLFNYNQTQSTWLIQFNFKGIGGIGSGDPTSDMKINIPGYMPISAMPAPYQN